MAPAKKATVASKTRLDSPDLHRSETATYVFTTAKRVLMGCVVCIGDPKGVDMELCPNIFSHHAHPCWTVRKGFSGQTRCASNILGSPLACLGPRAQADRFTPMMQCTKTSRSTLHSMEAPTKLSTHLTDDFRKNGRVCVT